MTKQAATLLALSFVSASLAQPMWVKNGETFGQGHAFELGQRCVAVTPAHVVRGAADRVRLIDVNGDVLYAAVLEKDETNDVALLIVDDASDHMKCRRAPPTFSIARLAEFEPRWTSMPGAWFDLIASAAGGFDRFDMALPKHPPSVAASEFTVSIKTGPDPDVPRNVEGQTGSGWDRRSDAHPGRFNRMPMRGNSGAMLWIGTRDTGHYTEGRYEGDGKVRARANGYVAGMLLRLKNNEAYLVAVPTITNFIAQTLRPMDASKLVIDSAGTTITDRGRGSEIGYSRSMGNDLLTDLSTEFDVGDEDTEFLGVSLLYDVSEDSNHRYDPHPRFRASLHNSQDPLIMYVSQFRPQEGRDWRPVTCKGFKWEPVSKTSMPEHVRLNCELTQPVVARGIRITLRGVPGRWRGLKVNLAR